MNPEASQSRISGDDDGSEKKMSGRYKSNTALGVTQATENPYDTGLSAKTREQAGQGFASIFFNGKNKEHLVNQLKIQTPTILSHQESLQAGSLR